MILYFSQITLLSKHPKVLRMEEAWNFYKPLAVNLNEPKTNKKKKVSKNTPDTINLMNFKNNAAKPATSLSSAQYCPVNSHSNNNIINNNMTAAVDISRKTDQHVLDKSYGQKVLQPPMKKPKRSAGNNKQSTSGQRNNARKISFSDNELQIILNQLQQDDSYQFLLSLWPYMREMSLNDKLTIRHKLQKVFIDEMERQNKNKHSNCTTTTAYQTPIPTTGPPPPPYTYSNNFMFNAPQPPKSNVEVLQQKQQINYTTAITNEPSYSYSMQSYTNPGNNQMVTSAVQGLQIYSTKPECSGYTF